MKSVAEASPNKFICEYCGARSAVLSTEIQKFGYSEKGREVELEARIPVLACSSCHERYAADGAEEAYHEAVCAYLGRLTPAQIRSLRKQKGFTQRDLAELLGAGIASIKRWETGAVIQNASADRQLRSAFEATNVEQRWSTPQFRTHIRPETYAAAEHFVLRMNILASAETF